MFWVWREISMRWWSLAELCPAKPRKWSNLRNIFRCTSPLSQPWKSDESPRPEPNPSLRGSATDTARTVSEKWTPKTLREFLLCWPSRAALRERWPIQGRVRLQSIRRRQWSKAANGSTLFWVPNSWSSWARNCPSFRNQCNPKQRRKLLQRQRRGTRLLR